jgi:transposase-like protein
VKEMKRTKYTPEFKEEAVKQVIDKGYAVPDVSKRPQSDASRDGQTQG